MDHYSLGGRYQLRHDDVPTDTAATNITHGVDMLNGQQVQLTRIALPETITVDSPTYGPDPGTDQPDCQNPDGPVMRACAAIRDLTRMPDHPNLTQVFDVLIDDGALWIVSEHVAARPLATLLAEKLLEPSRAAEIAREILRALRVLHAHGWLHRNITAHTVLIYPETSRVLIDGLAQSIADEALCGYRARPLPRPDDDETTQRLSGAWPKPAARAAQLTRTLPRGFTPSHTGRGSAALRADAQRHTARSDCHPAPPYTSGPNHAPSKSHREEGGQFRGPVTALETQRARDARILRVGAVSERWAPEQAAPVSKTWQLAPPISPSVDLWALGVLMFRALQGHPPFPEEHVDDLVALVCTEPAAFAEDCGEMRAVIECLLRPDPMQRLSSEDAERWLLSLVRQAREPTRPVQPAETPASRLPMLRLRAHLAARQTLAPVAIPTPRAAQRLRGRNQLVVVALLISLTGAAGVALALSQVDPTKSSPATAHRKAPPTHSSSEPADGTVARDPAGFQISLSGKWKRNPEADKSRVRFTRGDLTLIVIPGRDSVSKHGSNPLDYQQSQPELAAYRADPGSTSDGVRRIDVGLSTSLAKGEYVFTTGTGTLLYARNQAFIVNGQYHVVLVQGPASERERVTHAFTQAVATYQPHRAQQ